MEVKNNLRFTDQYGERQMREDHLKMVLGFQGRKWPAEGVPETKVGNVTVWVKPLGEEGFKIRTLCRCPQCFKITPAGRLEQHMKVHTLGG